MLETLGTGISWQDLGDVGREGIYEASNSGLPSVGSWIPVPIACFLHHLQILTNKKGKMIERTRTDLSQPSKYSLCPPIFQQHISAVRREIRRTGDIQRRRHP